ncbi:glutathione S-transferase family protein [Sphingomonas qomolangmaensis]|uniref:Glutathione S-transferase family protein n=1 Tax=Sphingomonas qomolangmaensis TaxID=2918765 RepID=A0ABY5LA87_9SPHN|nr:glutathione S-transferase family protein [Sphingomonas qomolangmaensis]UUL82958.1 glutathione S-transferase family protein [Sphingomonas qomolangmaensis]
MGQLTDGRWSNEQPVAPTDEKGDFQRADSTFRDWLTADGSPGPDGQRGVRAEADRFHLYVSLACPWAHRTLIVRALKGLEDLLPVTVVGPIMGKHGWSFQEEFGGTGDPLYGFDHLHQIYTRSDPTMSGKVTVPVLWDRKEARVVNNESSEIIRMFNTAFDDLGAKPGDFYPAELRGEIDALNDRVYQTVNNGVYRAGFAKQQAAYEKAARALFESLDWLEHHLDGREWLVGDRMTEADIRLVTTLMRFDPVYHGHFKCNWRRIVDYPRLHRLMERMMAVPGIAETVDLNHIKTHYYRSHPDVNPTGIVPIGPASI